MASRARPAHAPAPPEANAIWAPRRENHRRPAAAAAVPPTPAASPPGPPSGMLPLWLHGALRGRLPSSAPQEPGKREPPVGNPGHPAGEDFDKTRHVVNRPQGRDLAIFLLLLPSFLFNHRLLHSRRPSIIFLLLRHPLPLLLTLRFLGVVLLLPLHWRRICNLLRRQAGLRSLPPRRLLPCSS